MKKLLLVGAVALFAVMNAQDNETVGFNKGNTFITGAIGYATQTQGEFKNSNFTIAPSVGYFATPNIALGTRIGFSNTTESVKIANLKLEDKSNLFTAGLFGRYYWMPASRFSIFAELNANYATQKFTEDNASLPDTEYKLNGFSVGFAPGISYFISNHFALEASVGVFNYMNLKEDEDGAESVEDSNIGINLNDISFGLIYKF